MKFTHFIIFTWTILPGARPGGISDGLEKSQAEWLTGWSSTIRLLPLAHIKTA
jgi:hypothetical protein